MDHGNPVAAIMLKLGKKPGDGAGPPEQGDGDGGGGDEGVQGLHVAAEQLIQAVHAGDTAAVADALKAAFDMLESMPHEEAGPDEGGGQGEG